MTLNVIKQTEMPNLPTTASPDNATNRSRSRTRSRSSSGERSHSRSISRHSSRSYSRSRSRSRSQSRSHHHRRRSRSYSRSRSRDSRRSYTRSYSHSSSCSGDDNHHRKTRSPISRPQSHTSRSRSKDSSLTNTAVAENKKDPRDRSKRDRWENAGFVCRYTGIKPTLNCSDATCSSIHHGKLWGIHFCSKPWIVGEKVKDLTFHICDICMKPIVIYGRVMPCKHVYCYPCATGLAGICHRCKKKISSLDRCMLGGIFMCFEDKRTYLSQRDLQAHVDHRHKPKSVPTAVATSSSAKSTASALLQPPAPIPTLFQQQPVRIAPQQSKPIHPIHLSQQQSPMPPGSQQTAMMFNQAASFMMSTGSGLPAFQPNMPPPGLVGAPSSHQVPPQIPQRSLLAGGNQTQSSAIAALAAAIQVNSGGVSGRLSAVSSLCPPVRTLHHPITSQSPNLWSGLPYPHSQNRGPPPM